MPARIGSEFVADTTTIGDQFEPTGTGLPDGHFVLTWASSNGGQWARFFNNNGTAVGNDFIVNTTIGGGGASAFTTLPGGRFIMTWESNDDGDGSFSCIRARLFNSDGTGVGNDFVVDSSATSSQYGPAVASLTDGHFLMAWTSNDGGDGSAECIRARLFNGNGSAVIQRERQRGRKRLHSEYIDREPSGWMRSRSIA